MSNPKSRVIYYLEGVSSNEVANAMIQFLKEGQFKSFPSNEKMDFEGAKPTVIAYRPRHIQHLAIKFEFLIHLLCYRQIYNGEGMFTLNATILQGVLGKDYYLMLRTLHLLNHIIISSYYAPKHHSRQYAIAPQRVIQSHYVKNDKLDKLFTSLEKLLYTSRYKKKKKIASLFNNRFDYGIYSTTLAQIHVTDMRRLKTLIKENPMLSRYGQMYYELLCRSTLKEKMSIYSVDKNKRIYSHLTNLPKIIRPFLNLKYSMDISNSHPLLFNIVLFTTYRINSSIAIDISTHLSSLSFSIHYDSRFDYHDYLNDMINRKIRMPRDVLKYIALTSSGKLWDYMLSIIENEDKNILRSDIKTALFAEAFYSNTNNLSSKEYAPIFKQEFPFVYSIITKIRQDYEEGALPNILMHQESKMIMHILHELYERNYMAVNIHDEIIIPDLPANENLTKEEVSEIIQDVYADKGLFPTTKLTEYNTDSLHNFIEEKEKEYTLISDRLKELREAQSKDDTVAKHTLEKLSDGSHILCLADDKKTVILHKKD